MKDKRKLYRILYTIGIIALIAGILDPLEGSVVILAGSFLIALSTFFAKALAWKTYLSCFAMIAVGIIFLFYFSSLGGFGDGSSLSWWWGILILPYPAGWLVTVILFIYQAVKRKGLL